MGELSLQRAFTEFAPAAHVASEVQDKSSSAEVVSEDPLKVQRSKSDSTKHVGFEGLPPREPWIVQAKNTFINVSVATEEGDESMPRNKSDPTKKNDKESQESDAIDDLPPGLPSPLSFERFTTYDSFQDLHMNREVEQKSTGYAQSSLRPPPQLPLESIVTDDPFQDSIDFSVSLDGDPKASGHPLELSLDRIITDDPCATPQAVNLTNQSSLLECSVGLCSLAPPELSLDHITTDDPFQWTPPEKTLKDGDLLKPACATDVFQTQPSDEIDQSGSLPAPSELSLDRIVTEDPFQSTYVPEAVGNRIARSNVAKVSDSSEQTSWQSSTVPAPMYVILASASNVLPARAAPLVSAPPIAPPLTTAPTLEAPLAPDAPLAPPSCTPGASLSALLDTDLCQPGLLVHVHGNCTHVHWAVDGRKLERQDKQAVSPVFQVPLLEYVSAPFKIVLNAVEKKVAGDRKKGAGFHRAKGHGRIALKCEADLPESCAEIAMRIGVGRKEKQQPLRGPVIQDFVSNSCHGLETDIDEWNFAKSVDEHNVFVVTLEIAPAASLRSNASIWWASDGDHSA